jgi:hypothetical protein
MYSVVVVGLIVHLSVPWLSGIIVAIRITGHIVSASGLSALEFCIGMLDFDMLREHDDPLVLIP